LAIKHLEGLRIQGSKVSGAVNTIGTTGNWDTTSNIPIASSVTTPSGLGDYYWDANGSSSRLQITDGYIFPTNTDFTFSCWCNPDSLTNNGNLLNRTYPYPDSNVTKGNQIEFNTNGTDIYFALQTADQTISTMDAHDMTTGGGWYNVVQTWDRSAGEVKIYVNNSLKVTGQHNNAINSDIIQDNWSAITGGGNSDTFDGQCMEFTIWNKKLSTNDIYDLYYGSTGGSGGSAGVGKLANTIELGNILVYYAPASSGYTNQAVITDDRSGITNIQAGTRFEEIDTRKIFRRKDEGYAVGIGSDADWTTITSLGTNSSVTSPTGLGANSWTFNGSNTLLKMDTAGRSSLFPVASDFSISFWQSESDQATNATSQNQPYIFPTDGSGVRWEQAYSGGLSGGRVVMEVNDGSNTCNTDSNGTQAHGLVDDDWYLWIFTFDASNGTGILYKGRYGTDSNVSQYRTSGTSSCTGAPDDSMYLLGTISSESYGNPSTGRMNDYAIWNKVLSSSEMHDMFNSESGSAGGTAKKAVDIDKTALRAYWDCQTSTAPVKNLAVGAGWVEKGTA